MGVTAWVAGRLGHDGELHAVTSSSSPIYTDDRFTPTSDIHRGDAIESSPYSRVPLGQRAVTSSSGGYSMLMVMVMVMVRRVIQSLSVYGSGALRGVAAAVGE
jgi:hypothetical protein